MCLFIYNSFSFGQLSPSGKTTTMFLIIYALNVAGDALRDALDPKLID